MQKDIVVRKLKKYICYSVFFVYCTWFLFFVNKGLDITDAGYVLVLYKYAFTPGTQTVIGIGLSNILGGILWKLIPTAQALVLSILSAILYTVDGFLIYKMLKKYADSLILLLMMLAASFFSITWVHILHYNALSMLFLTLEMYMLFCWFEKTEKKYLFVCGLLYGVNIWIRIPNCVHGICIFAVLWFIAHHENRKDLWNHLTTMALGVLAGFSAATVLVVGVHGMGNVASGIKDIFSIGVESTDVNNGHSFFHMFETIKNYLQTGVRILPRYLVVPVICSVIGYIMEKAVRREEKRDITTRVLMILNACIGIAYGYFVFRRYFEEATVLSFCIVLSIVCSLFGAIYFRRSDLTFSALCVMTVLLETVIVFGTDNSVLWNRVFLFLPLGMVASLCQRLLQTNFRNFSIGVLSFVTVLVFCGSFQFATTYVYRDAQLRDLTCTVNANVYRGIRTSEDRADLVNNLERELNKLPQGELLSMGRCTVGSLISDMPPVTTAWPDVRAYTAEQFSNDLDHKLNQGMVPYILLVYPTWELTELEQSKYEKVNQIMEEYQYKEVYADDDFSLYIPGNGLEH